MRDAEADISIYKVYERHCVVLCVEPGKYHLGAHEMRARDGYRTWFGDVEIKRRYVSAHLMPVCVHPELLADVSDALRKRMQGKSCFNFSSTDATLSRQLRLLADAGFRRFRADGRL